MYDVGDLVVVESVDTSAWQEIDFDGYVLQIVEDTSEKTRFRFLDGKDGNIYTSTKLTFRKIVVPLKFRGGKIINYKDASAPF